MAFSGGPWGQVLQEPYTTIDAAGGPDHKRAMWMARQGTMNDAQAQALAELSAALQAGRDKQMADLLAKNQGGGGSSGGGGSAAAVFAPVTAPSVPSWLDQFLNQQSAPPPAYDARLAPSTQYGARNVYKAVPLPLKPAAYSTTIAPNRKGYRPAPVTHYASRLS